MGPLENNVEHREQIDLLLDDIKKHLKSSCGGSFKKNRIILLPFDDVGGKLMEIEYLWGFFEIARYPVLTLILPGEIINRDERKGYCVVHQPQYYNSVRDVLKEHESKKDSLFDFDVV